MLTKPAIASIMIFLLLTISPIVICQNQIGITSNQYIQGKMDGELQAKGEPAWAGAGLLLGPLGVLMAYVYPANPPMDSLLDKPIEYTYGFTENFKSTTKGKNAAYALGGWASWIIIYFAFFND